MNHQYNSSIVLVRHRSFNYHGYGLYLNILSPLYSHMGDNTKVQACRYSVIDFVRLSNTYTICLCTYIHVDMSIFSARPRYCISKFGTSFVSFKAQIVQYYAYDMSILSKQGTTVLKYINGSTFQFKFCCLMINVQLYIWKKLEWYTITPVKISTLNAFPVNTEYSRIYSHLFGLQNSFQICTKDS